MKTLKIFLIVVIVALFIPSAMAEDNKPAPNSNLAPFLEQLKDYSVNIGTMCYLRGLETKFCGDLNRKMQDKVEDGSITSSEGKKFDMRFAKLLDDFAYQCCEMGRRDRETKTMDYLKERRFAPKLRARIEVFIMNVNILQSEKSEKKE